MLARQETKTTCPYCGTGCGVKVAVDDAGRFKVSGDESHPANRGKLCVKGTSLAETLVEEGRLLHPEIGGQRASWDEALDTIATRIQATIDEHGPESFAFYVSGQILTEDYYVANKWVKGYLGTANIDTNSRLCMASSVAGHKRAFGSDTVPNVYEDLELADLVILVGSNLAWCHPVLYQRLAAARAQRPSMRIVVIDPRRTATCEIADLHLAIEPGSDVPLFLGLLRELERRGARDARFVAEHTDGLDAALAEAQPWDMAAVARASGLSLADLTRFFDWAVSHEKMLTLYSQGVNQSAAGTDKVNALLNCHLLTGRIGKPGSGPLSATGQPNAMGGREVGGLANMLACHMELANAEHRALVQGFWQSPRIADTPGLKAIELFDAVESGKIKALWIMGTNPVDSLPQAHRVEAALARCPFVVVSDVVTTTDTARHAHALLPAQAWGEKEGTVTNSERRISRQRRLKAPLGEAMPDWWAIAQVARRMGFEEGFTFTAPFQIFREYAQLSGFRNEGTRDFDISAHAGIDALGYARLMPFQWPWRRGEPDTLHPKRFFAEGRFYTPDQRARFVATPYRPPVDAPDESFPLVLNSGRIRDQWHTMTRTGIVARLSQHISEPFVEIHPEDAAERGIEPASVVEVESAHGSVLLRAQITDRQRRGGLFVPIHWTDQFASDARVSKLFRGHLDPVSGQPESKAQPAQVRPARLNWYGFALLAQKPAKLDAAYWAQMPVEGGVRMELAGAQPLTDADAQACALFGLPQEAAPSLVRVTDPARGRFWYAHAEGDRVLGLVFFAPTPVEAARDWLCGEFARAKPQDMLRLLAGRPALGRPEPGRKVCICFDVGVNTIVSAVRAQGLTTVEDIGRATGAGTGCGSCKPEIARILREIEPAAPLLLVGE